jgi:hypothetical protein
MYWTGLHWIALPSTCYTPLTLYLIHSCTCSAVTFPCVPLSYRFPINTHPTHPPQHHGKRPHHLQHPPRPRPPRHPRLRPPLGVPAQPPRQPAVPKKGPPVLFAGVTGEGKSARGEPPRDVVDGGSFVRGDDNDGQVGTVPEFSPLFIPLSPPLTLVHPLLDPLLPRCRRWITCPW